MNKGDIIYTDKLIKELNMILPKLKYRITVGQVEEWLANFDPNDRLKALEILFFLEYITEEEIIQILDELIEKLLSQLKYDLKKSKRKLLFISVLPSDDNGKSGVLMLYYLNKCPTYKRLKRLKKADSVHRLEALRSHTIYIHLEDFIGSGDTLFKYFANLKFPIKSNHVVMSLFIMKKAHNRISEDYSKLSIISNIRNKALDRSNGVFNFKFAVDDIESVILKYGNRIPVDAAKNTTPLGYGDSESLLCFAHGVPNNTFPIMWGEGLAGDATKGWKPILPRYSDTRVSKAKAFKRKMAYWIGIINRLQIDVSEGGALRLTQDNYHLHRQWNHKTMFHLLVLMELLHKGHGKGVILQILGITEKEFLLIEKTGKSKQYLYDNAKLTDLGLQFLTQIKKKSDNKQKSDLYKNNYAVMAEEEYIMT